MSIFKNIQKQTNFGSLKVFIKSYWPILLIFLIGLILRVIYLHDTIAIGKDQVDHLIFAHQIWDNHGFIWHGARIRSGLSAAGQNIEVYLGPFYFYLLSIPAWLGRWSFFLPTLLDGLLSAAAILLMYHLTRLITENKAAANLSALLFAFSTAFVIASRTIWNPFYLPFFLFITIISFIKLIKGNQKYLIVFVLFLSLCTQLHASALLLIPAFIILWFVYQVKIKNWSIWLYSTLVLILSYLPMVYHEIKSNFENIRNFYQILFHSTVYGVEKISYFQNFIIVIKKFVESFSLTLDGRVYESAWGLSVWPNNLWEKFYRYPIGSIFILVSLIILFNIVWKRKFSQWRTNLLLIPLVIFYSFLSGSMFFKYDLYLYYFATVIPVTYILLAYALIWLSNKHILGKIFTIIFITFFCYINLTSFVGYIYARAHRAQHQGGDFIIPDMLLKDKIDLLDVVKNDSLTQGAKFDFILGDSSTSEVYSYLIKLKNIKETDRGNISYLIVDPRTMDVSKRIEGHVVLLDRIFGSIRLIKYED